MAQSNNDAATGAVASTEPSNAVNGAQPAEEQSQGDLPNGHPPETLFQVAVKLPHEPYKTEITVSLQEPVQEIKAQVIEAPYTFQYTCFHLEHDGERINDFVELSEVQGIGPGSELTLVEDPYTEKEARLHVSRVREIIGAAGDRTDTLHGILAGLSLHDSVSNSEKELSGAMADGGSPKVSTADASSIANYDLDAPGTAKTLVPPTREPPPKTLKSISLSPWNPPPYYYRGKGHLLYLQVTTNEGEQYQITSHVSGFYVNRSTSVKFDPSPREGPKNFSAHSLLTLLTKVSPSFESTFKTHREYDAKKDPLAVFQLTNAIPASPWLVPPAASPQTTHQPDITRTQESYLLGGIETPDTLRDWNEELQNAREMPREAVHDRVFRERLTSKLFHDYNDAATRGAVLVARGELNPLNPTESRDAQIYVYNNIFFSFGADGVGTFATEGGDEAARVATGKDVIGVRNVNQLDIPALFTPGTVVVDYMGKRIVGQSIVPGIFKQREPGENQIDYGGVEGKDVVAENEAFAPLFEQLSKAMRVKKHPVWDKEGKRHDLEGSVETKGLLGTDGRKYALDLYRLTPLDVDWIEQHWSERDAESTPKDPNKDYPHRMAVLRPELVDSFGRIKLRDYIRAELAKRAEAKKAAAEQQKANGEKPSAESEKEAGQISSTAANEGSATKAPADAEPASKETEQDHVDMSNFQFALNPDVFCGQAPQTEAEKKEYEADEAEVQAACKFLTSDVIPRLVGELQEGEVGFPMDGQSLSTLLHKRGINIRYLGKIAELADKPSPRLQALKKLAIQEMLSRGFKHVANEKLRYLPVPFVAACIAHLLNCLLGVGLNGKPKAEPEEALKTLYPDADFSFEMATPESLKKEIQAQVRRRYRYNLGKEWIDSTRCFQMLREISLKLGLQLEAKDYAFTKEQAINGAEAPERATTPTNGQTGGSNKKKKKGGDRTSPDRASISARPLQNVTFHPEDILNIVPIVKEASPKSALAEEALEAGRISIAQDQKELGHELLLESMSLHEQIYGILHPEVARVYHQLSNIFYTLDDKAAALELAHKAVIVAERTLGVDHAETVLSYLNLALAEHACNNPKTAMTYIRHALDLWKIAYGLKHPDSITTLNNAAVMLQSMKLFHESRLWFEASLQICEDIVGKKSPSTATMLFQLSQALALDQDMQAAVSRMREAYHIFKDTLGPEDRNTKDAENWLEQLTQAAVSRAKQTREQQQRAIRRGGLLASRGGLRVQPRVGQSQADPTGTRSAQSHTVDKRSIEDLMKYIEGDTTPKPTKKRTQNPKRRGQRSS